MTQAEPARVSIVIPTYNRSDLLRLTVESVLAQTYSPIEVIVVDDGSTDDTPEVMAHYADSAVYIRQCNQGRNRAIKVGVDAAIGLYIGILDHDDLFMPTKVEQQVRMLDAYPEYGLVHCRFYHIDEAGNKIDKVGILPEGKVLKKLVGDDFIWSGAPLIRREILDHVGLPEDDIWGGDWDLWLRIALAGYAFGCVQELLGAYRIVQGGMATNVVAMERGIFEDLDRVFARPDLPADVRAIEDQAYGMRHFWLSCRHYASGQWDDAQRNMAAALARLPYLAHNPEALLNLLRDDALSARVSDPLQFAEDVLTHMPTSARHLSAYRAQLLSRIHVGLALRDFAAERLAEAQAHLTQAVAYDPATCQHGDEFSAVVTHYAMRLPIESPQRFVDTVFHNLPPGAQSLGRLHTHVLGDVSIAGAFEAHAAGRPQQTLAQLLTGLRYRPTWLRNRGVASLLLKSLTALARMPLRASPVDTAQTAG